MKTPKERVGIIVMACAGVLALIFGIWQINNNIKSPFRLKPIDKSLLSGDQMPDLTKDTDGDGLTDYEEANIYDTSPYLADTDSDSAPDNQEIQIGTDPNCPEGKDCKASAEPAQVPAAALEIPNSGGDAQINAGLPANLPADEIRKLLKQGGMSDENLNKLDDKALLEIYDEAVKEVNKGQ